MFKFLIWIALLPVAIPAAAEPARQVTVATADLDLASSSGRATLRTRLDHAAREACDTRSTVDLKSRNRDKNCREQVIADGMRLRVGEALAAR